MKNFNREYDDEISNIDQQRVRGFTKVNELLKGFEDVSDMISEL